METNPLSPDVLSCHLGPCRSAASGLVILGRFANSAFQSSQVPGHPEDPQSLPDSKCEDMIPCPLQARAACDSEAADV